MQKNAKVTLYLVVVFSFLNLTLNAQDLFSAYDCRKHADLFYETVVVEPVEVVDSAALLALAKPETVTTMDTINGWKEWSYVQNFTYGKDRGAMAMITDLDALHPYFRDRIKQLIIDCEAQGIHLAVVESYRTHAKQNEYKVMGRKYTNSGAGRSRHQYGLAVDVVPMVDSVAQWDDKALWKRVGVTGEKLGLRWGGRWKKPYDPGHFEWTGGLTSAHLIQGVLPPVPDNQYPCLQEDIKLLRKYWKEWETSQSAMTRK